MALHSANIEVEHREILLKNKPPAMLQASTKGTVPVLILPSGKVLDESWEVAQWALLKNDPLNWLGTGECFLKRSRILVQECDGEFKKALDKYKYADRHPLTAEVYRQQGLPFLTKLNDMLAENSYLLADRCTIADIAVMPFVRQFAHVDSDWLKSSGLDDLVRWLNCMLESDLFIDIMQKRALWKFET